VTKAVARLGQLDGLRGVAAVMVVASHICAGFSPALFFGPEKAPVMSWQGAFATSPAFVLVNGSFAVFIFFVLSGFVISAAADRSDAPILANCVARYLRLSIPCAASIAIAAALLPVRTNWAPEASALTGHWWLAMYAKPEAHSLSWGGTT
jgi:peptidoglycan/LPS O-acetylase OafA/YrhL